MNSPPTLANRTSVSIPSFAQTIGHRTKQQRSKAYADSHKEELGDQALAIKSFHVRKPGRSPQ